MHGSANTMCRGKRTSTVYIRILNVRNWMRFQALRGSLGVRLWSDFLASWSSFFNDRLTSDSGRLEAKHAPPTSPQPTDDGYSGCRTHGCCQARFGLAPHAVGLHRPQSANRASSAKRSIVATRLGTSRGLQ